MGYLVLSVSTDGHTPAETYELLKRCYVLFVKRLRARYPRKWRKLLWRVEASETGRFPHLNVVLFGWKYVPKTVIHRIWGDVTAEVTGKRATAARVSGLSAKEAGRLAHYAFKEAVTGLSSYLWKEGRPVWLPKGRRMWAKSPGLEVYAWPTQRRTTVPDRKLVARPDGVSLDPRRRSTSIVLARSLPGWFPLGDGVRGSPPVQLSLSL